jgi:hypothetical protein
LLDIYQAEMIMVNNLTGQRLKRARPDLVLRPRVGFDVTLVAGIHRAPDIIAAGESATQAALSEVEAMMAPSIRWGLSSLFARKAGSRGT